MLVMNNVDNSEVIMKIRLLLNSIIGNVLKFKVWFHFYKITLLLETIPI